MSRRPGTVPTAAGEVQLRARDLADGQAVRWRGEAWRVWSKRGPRAGTVWLVRVVTVPRLDEWGVPVEQSKTESAEAPIRELTTGAVTWQG